MGLYNDRVLPRLVDLALSGKAFAALRARVVADVAGEVVEIGFGSGRNVPFYGPSVTRVHAVDPAVAGQRLAAKRLAATHVPVDFVGLYGEQLPLADESVDHAVSTWTLCTIPDAHRALAEIRRVLRPGGALHFIEHGRAPDPTVARWQDRLTPLQRKVAGGCHLNRPIDDLIRMSGLRTTRLENFFMPGPRVFGYMYEGVAAKP
jgi:ubiquinone/menaquinone biosynthesis C-methylase UbiE